MPHIAEAPGERGCGGFGVGGVAGARVARGRDDGPGRLPRVVAQPRPLQHGRTDVQCERGGDEPQCPTKPACCADGKGARLAREVTLKKIGGGSKRGAVLVPMPRRDGHERGAAVPGPRAKLRVLHRKRDFDARHRGARARQLSECECELRRQGAGIRRTILTALPHRVQLRGHRLFEEVDATLAAYVRAQLIACVVVGTLCGAGFAVLGNPYAILLGVLAAVLEFIPLLGPLVVAVVAVGLAAIDDSMLAIWTAVFLTAVRMLQDYVIYPRLIGRDIHLHPLAVILAVLAGAELGGIAGIFVAVPLVALVTVAGRHWLEWRGPDAESLQVAPASAFPETS